MLRAILVILFVLLAGGHAVRTAAVKALAEEQPAKVAGLWPGHPDMLRSVAMGEVGEAAGRGQAPPPSALQRLEQLALAEPLAPEPFLVQGAIAQRGGDGARAEQLLAAARTRDPRSAAARFLLADLYLRNGRILPGLAEMSVLARLVPGAMQQVAPALAAFATSAGAVPHLKRILLAHPELEPALLSRLAEQPRNAELILAIARPRQGGEEPPRWHGILLAKLVEDGDYARAHSVWSRLTAVPPEASRGLVNADFARDGAPPPFGWTLAASSQGVAEPGGGGLRVLYFGRDDAVLASQLMLLPAGRYRIAMRVSGLADDNAGIGWTVTCLPREQRVLELPLGDGPIAGNFAVPVGCQAQRLELQGTAKEFSRSTDFRIAGVRLVRIGG